MLRQTHTFVLLAISPAAYQEIAGLLREAQYDHVFIDADQGRPGAGDPPLIDMHGLALQKKET